MVSYYEILACYLWPVACLRTFFCLDGSLAVGLVKECAAIYIAAHFTSNRNLVHQSNVFKIVTYPK